MTAKQRAYDLCGSAVAMMVLAVFAAMVAIAQRHLGIVSIKSSAFLKQPETWVHAFLIIAFILTYCCDNALKRAYEPTQESMHKRVMRERRDAMYACAWLLMLLWLALFLFALRGPNRWTALLKYKFWYYGALIGALSICVTFFVTASQTMIDIKTSSQREEDAHEQGHVTTGWVIPATVGVVNGVFAIGGYIYYHNTDAIAMDQVVRRNLKDVNEQTAPPSATAANAMQAK